MDTTLDNWQDTSQDADFKHARQAVVDNCHPGQGSSNPGGALVLQQFQAECANPGSNHHDYTLNPNSVDSYMIPLKSLQQKSQAMIRFVNRGLYTGYAFVV